MRISSFVPAVLALGLFSATTQALPTPSQQQDAVNILKRGSGNVVDAVADLFVKIETDVLLNACLHVEADVCADIIVKLNAKAGVLGLIEADVNVKDLEVRAKAAVDLDIKAKLRAEVEAKVIAHIRAHVYAVVAEICPGKNNRSCIRENAHAIVVAVVAKINVDIQKLIVTLKADLEAHAKIRIGVHIQKLAVELGLANVKVSAIVRVRSDIDIHIKLFVDLCAKLLLDAKLVAKIGAL